MSISITGYFDGQVFRAREPVELPPNTEVTIHVDTPAEDDPNAYLFLKVASSMNLEGPSDWSTNFKDYLRKGGPDPDD